MDHAPPNFEGKEEVQRTIINTREFLRVDQEDVRSLLLRAFAPRTNEAQLVDQLRASEQASIELVAEARGKLVGHIVFSPVTLEPARPDIVGLSLGPVCVSPLDQGRGTGSSLIRAGLQKCRDQDIDFVVVLGAPDYYSRFGFRLASNYGLSSDYDAPDAFAVQELKAGVLNTIPSSLVHYAPEFKATGC
jgi:putative acetyltransferase